RGGVWAWLWWGGLGIAVYAALRRVPKAYQVQTGILGGLTGGVLMGFSNQVIAQGGLSIAGGGGGATTGPLVPPHQALSLPTTPATSPSAQAPAGDVEALIGSLVAQNPTGL